jgi:arabinogalactan endo-1,4-beta-galactosidase
MHARNRFPFRTRGLGYATVVLALAACSSSNGVKNQGTGGSPVVTGGAKGSGAAIGSGGVAAGGALGTGGATQLTGGAQGLGGANASGGMSGTGGASSGGASGLGGATGRGGTTGSGGRIGTGGAADAGMVASGGRTDASTGSGGASAGGTAGGSDGGSNLKASFYIGADITNAESASGAAQDSLLSQLQAHGFNAIRLRTFVDPKAADGYDKTNGYADTAHTATFGKKVKDLGMALLVDFHYSDNWADPGKQCVPVAWQSYTTIADLATAVHDYTKDAITKLIAGGARPDMVQIGNETTPGMLLHVCDSGGQPTGSNQVTGSTSNWTNLGTLFKAGVQGVKDVDTGILIALHIDRCGDKPTETQGSALSTSKSYINNATKQGVAFDVFGESCYQRYQGDPNNATTTKAGWTNTFNSLASAYPNLKFMAAEYGPMQREINDVVFAVANQQGIGTFNWEPDTSGDWNTGHVLFTRSGNTYTAQPDLALYDQMKIDYASRL